MTDEEHRRRTEYGVVGLMKAIQDENEREMLRHGANLLADVLVTFVRLERAATSLAESMKTLSESAKLTGITEARIEGEDLI